MGLLSVGLAYWATRIGAETGGNGLPIALAAALFLAPPVFFGLLWGALGTVWYEGRFRGGSSGADSTLIESGTGLYSPEYMMHQIRHALSQVARSRKTVTLLILECQESGDDVSLRLLANTVEPLVRVGDILGRIGPGRLLVLIPGDLPCACCVLQRMGHAFHAKTHLSLRAGVARWPEDGLLPTDLLTAADLVLKATWTAFHASGCPASATVPASSSRVSR
jgi:GGDEF domain-containing protein